MCVALEKVARGCFVFAAQGPADSTKAPGKDAQATKNVKKKSDGSGAAAVATLVDMMMAACCGLIKA